MLYKNYNLHSSIDAAFKSLNILRCHKTVFEKQHIFLEKSTIHMHSPKNSHYNWYGGKF